MGLIIFLAGLKGKLLGICSDIKLSERRFESVSMIGIIVKTNSYQPPCDEKVLLDFRFQSTASVSVFKVYFSHPWSISTNPSTPDGFANSLPFNNYLRNL